MPTPLTPLELLKQDKSKFKEIFVNPYLPKSPTMYDTNTNVSTDKITNDVNTTGILHSSSVTRNKDDNQNFLESFGTGILKGVLKAPGSLLENFGNIFDFDDDYLTNNALQSWGKQWKGTLDEAMPIYKGDGNHWFDDGWWAENISGLVDSVSAFAITGALTGGLLNVGGTMLGAGLSETANLLANSTKISTALKGEKALQWLNGTRGVITEGLSQSRLLGEGSKILTNAYLLNKAESVTIAADAAKNTFQFNYNKLIKTGNTPEYAEKEAKRLAGEAGAKAMAVNQINILLNLTSASKFIKATSSTRNTIEKAGHDIYKEILQEGSQEALEETINNIAQQSAEKSGRGNTYSSQDMFKTIFSDEGASSALMGFIGGAGQLALTHGINNLNGVNKKQNERYELQQQFINSQNEKFGVKENVATFDVLQNLQSNMKIHQELQQAYKNKDAKKIDELNATLLQNDAYYAFSSGTTNNLLNNWKGLNEWIDNNQEEAKTKGFDINPNSETFYKTKIEEGINQIKNLELQYLKAEKFENSFEVYQNRNNLNLRQTQERFLQNEINKKTEQLNSILQTQTFENEDELKAFEQIPEIKKLKLDISTTENNLNTIKNSQKDLELEYLTLTDKKTQSEIIEKRKQEKIKTDLKIKETLKTQQDLLRKKKKEDLLKGKAEKNKTKTDTKEKPKVENKTKTDTKSELEVIEEEDTDLEVINENDTSNNEENLNKIFGANTSNNEEDTNIPVIPSVEFSTSGETSNVNNFNIKEFISNLEVDNELDQTFLDTFIKETESKTENETKVLLFALQNSEKFKSTASLKLQQSLDKNLNLLAEEDQLNNNKEQVWADQIGDGTESENLEFLKKINRLQELFELLNPKILLNPSETTDNNSENLQEVDTSFEKLKLYGEIFTILPKSFIVNKDGSRVPLLLFFNKIASINDKFKEFTILYPEEIISIYNKYLETLFGKDEGFNITKQQFIEQFLPLLKVTNLTNLVEEEKKNEVEKTTLVETDIVDKNSPEKEKITSKLSYLFSNSVNSGNITRNREQDEKGFYHNVDDELSDNVNRDVLDINELNEGTEGTLMIDTLYVDENNINIFESLKNKSFEEQVLETPIIFVYTNSKGEVRKLSLNTIAYLEERLEIALKKGDETYIKLIEQELIKLQTIRENIIKKYNEDGSFFKTKVVNKGLRRIETTSKAKMNTLSEAFPDSNLEFVIFKNGKFISKIEDTEETLFDTNKYEIQNKTAFKNGTAYIVLPLKILANGKTLVYLCSNTNNTVSNEKATTFRNLLKLNLTASDKLTDSEKVSIEQLNEHYDLNIQANSFLNIKKIIGKNVKLYEGNVDLEKNVDELIKLYNKNRDTYKNKYFPKLLIQITSKKITILDLSTGVSRSLIQKNNGTYYTYILNNGVEQKSNAATFLKVFEKSLSSQLSNVDINSINQKHTDINIKVNEGVTNVNETEYDNYNTYVKDNLKTPFISFNIGTEKNPVYSYVTSTVELDMSEVLDETKKEDFVIPTENKEEVVEKKKRGRPKKETISSINPKNEEIGKLTESSLHDVKPASFFLDNPRELTDKELTNFSDFIFTLNYQNHYNTLISNYVFNILNKLSLNEKLNLNEQLENLKNHLQKLLDLKGVESVLLQSDIKNILKNFEQVKKDVKEGIIKHQNFVKIDELNYDLLLDSEEFENIKLEKKFNQDSLQSNPKNTLSNKFKVFLSTINETKTENSSQVVLRDVFGLKHYVSFSDIYNTLIEVLAGADNDFNTMYEILQLNINKYAWGEDLLEKLKNSDLQIKNQFVTSMTNHKNDMSLISYQYEINGKNIVTKLVVVDSNLNNKQTVLFNIFQQKFKTSKFTKVDDNNEIVQDREEIQKFLNFYDALVSNSLEKSNLDLFNDAKKILKEFGIFLNDKYLKDLEAKNIDGIIYIKNKGVILSLSEHFISEKGIFKTIYNDLKAIGESKKDLDLSLSKNNIFKSSTMKILANELAVYEKTIAPQSFANVNDKIFYSYSKNKFLNRRFKDLNENSELVSNLFNTPFAKSSTWLNSLWRKGKRTSIVFDYKSVDGISNQDSNTTKTFDELTSFEQDLFRLGQFINNNKNTSVFLFPTTFGKKTLGMLETERFNIAKFLNKDGEITSQVVKKMYDILVSPDINRILKINSLIQQIKEDNIIRVQEGKSELKLEDVINDKGLTAGWNKFYLIPELNNIPNILKKLEENFIEGKVQKEIEDVLKTWLEERIADQTAKWVENGVSKNGKLSIDDSYQEGLSDKFITSNYVLEQLIAYTNFTQIFVGDPAQFFKGNTIEEFVKENNLENKSFTEQQELYTTYFTNETLVNLGKRLNGHVAPKQELPSTSNKISRILVVNDRITDSIHIDYYNKLDKQYGTNIAEAYKNIKATDSQEYITLEEMLDKMIGLGEITETQYKDLLNKSKTETLTEEDIKGIFLPEKPVYFGEVFDKYNGEIIGQRMMYIKTSAIPLIPQFTKGLEIDKLRLLMEKENIHRVTFESAVKVGTPKKEISLFDKNGNIKNLSKRLNEDGIFEFFENENDVVFTENQIFELNKIHYGIQQNLPNKTTNNVVDGTQQRKLLFLDILGETNFSYNGKDDYTGKELYKEYTKLYKELISNQWEILQQELYKDGKIDNEKLSKILIKEGLQRGFIENTLNTLKTDKNGDFEIPLWLNTESNKIQSLFLSIIDSRLRKQETNGKSYVLVSEEGIKPEVKILENNETLSETVIKNRGIIFTDSYDKKKGLQRNQVIIPFKYKTESGKLLNLQDFVIDGKIDFNKLPKELLQIFGYRLPTQKHNSMFNLEVVGFSNSLEHYIVASRDLISQMGSDFDFDKLYTFSYNYEYSKISNKLSILNPKENIKKYKNELLQGQIKEITKVYNSLKNTLFENQNKYLEKVNNEINDIFNKPKEELSLNDLKTLNNYNNFIEDEIENIEKQKVSFSLLLKKQGINEDLFVDDFKNYDEQINALKLKSENSISILNSQDKLVNTEQLRTERLIKIKEFNTNLDNLNNLLDIKLENLYKTLKIDEVKINLTTKQLQNQLLSIHFSVMEHEKVKLYSSKPLDYGILKQSKNGKSTGIIHNINNLREDKKKTNYLITPLYNSEKYIESNIASESIGIFANVSMLNQFLQQAELFSLPNIEVNLEGTPISIREEFSLFGVKNKSLHEIDNETGLKSDSISAYLSSAVDNDKEQLLQKVNKYTYNFIKAALVYGYNEETIQLLLEQDIISDYIKENIKIHQIDDKTFGDKNTAVNKLLYKRYGENEYKGTLDKKDGYNLIKNGNKSKNYNEKQVTLFKEFLKLSEKGNLLGQIESIITFDSKGLKNNIFYVQALYDTYKELQNNKNIIGFNETYRESLNKVFFDKVANFDIKSTYDLYGNYHEILEGDFNTVYNKIIEKSKINLDESILQKSINKQQVFKEYLKFINTSPLTNLSETEIQNDRQILNYDVVQEGEILNLSLASIVDAFKNAGLNNTFINRLETNIQYNGNPSTIKFIGNFDNEVEESTIKNEIVKLFKDNRVLTLDTGEQFSTRELIQNLILYAHINDGITTNYNFVKYIPLEYYKLMGYDKFVKNKNNNINSENFIKQYFQHNVKEIKTEQYNPLRELSRNSYTKENISELNGVVFKNETYYVLNEETGDNVLITVPSVINIVSSKETLPDIFKVKYPERKKNIIYYKHGSYYYRIDELGNKLINEYNTEEFVQKSLIKWNTFEDKINLVEQKPQSRLQIAVRNNNLQSKESIYKLDKTINETLKFIANKSTNKLFKNISQEILNLDINIPQFIIDKELGSKGKYFNKTISINPDLHKSNEEFEETLLHEILHYVTTEFLNNPKTEKQRLILNTINNLQSKAKNEIISKLDISEKTFNNIVNDILKNGYRSKGLNIDGKTFTLSEQKIIYALSNIDEFFANVLTNKEVQDFLNTIKYSDGDTLVTKFVQLLEKLFEAIGLSNDTLLFYTTHQMMDFIKDINNNSNNNNNNQLVLFSPKEISENEVNYSLKIIDILQSDKAKQVFVKGEKNGWDLTKILNELGVSKQQQGLIDANKLSKFKQGRFRKSYDVFKEINETTKRKDLKEISNLLMQNNNSKLTNVLFIDSNDSVMGMNHQSYNTDKDGKINSIVRILDEKVLSDLDKQILGNYTEETVLHEEIHRYTTIVLMLGEKYTDVDLKELLNEKEIKFIREVQELHKVYKENGGYFKLQEFITYGLTNQDEIQKLKNIKIGKNNLLSKLIDSILDLLGVKESNLHELLKKSFSEYYTNSLNTNNYKENFSEFEAKYSKENTQSTREQIITGVKELFKENPELANSVYETLGIKPKADIILPIGTSGSGKSTFIKSLPQENLVVIEPDAMRVEFTGDMNDKSKDKEIYIEAANRAIKAIKQGKQVVFDTTNLTKDKRLPFIEAIKKAIPTANIQYKLMELNPELAKQRIKAQLERGENRAAVSDETIDRHTASYKQMLEDIKNEPISEFQNNQSTREQIITDLLVKNAVVKELKKNNLFNPKEEYNNELDLIENELNLLPKNQNLNSIFKNIKEEEILNKIKNCR